MEHIWIITRGMGKGLFVIWLGYFMENQAFSNPGIFFFQKLKYSDSNVDSYLSVWT